MDYALVTIQTADGKWQVDMELPARMRIKDVSVKILEAIKALDDDRFGEMSSLQLYQGGKVLNSMATLAEYQIWDGCILTISE